MPRKPDSRHKNIGGKHRASARYGMICFRVTSNAKKNKCYAGVEVRVSREEFVKWFMERDFTGCSVDRIDKRGHYEIANMQVIPLAENIRKDKQISDGVTCRCFVCKNTKPVCEFVSSPRRKSGIETICRECEARRNRLRGYAKRERLGIKPRLNRRKAATQEAPWT